ncbi:D-isomer specific 2-hydroxyacid dehydrogenase [Xylariaceae sp. FL0804]|nr:D-isomer specific 2-hydroxyacid dehydrogenase [Xylariaceae sp. FL0804]
MGNKPIVLHLGDDIRWNQAQYADFAARFDVRRSHSMARPEFREALRSGRFGDFVALYRPFWNTGGEMGDWDEELIRLLPDSCRIFASAGAGFDWVDTAAMARKGVVYCNAAAACTESVADAGLWLILSTFRLFSWSGPAARSCDPARFADANRNLAAATRNPQRHVLGIIGFGRIGRRIAEKAHRALEMRIVYNDVARLPAALERDTAAAFEPDVGALLAAADCVVVATPFGGDRLLGADLLGRMKPGGRLVNIARGKLIDEAALVAALRSGQVGAAGLDVHENEPHVNPELASMRNVEVLSHNAGASLDSHIGFERLGMENITSFLAKGRAVSPVNLHLMQQGKDAPSSRL